jgi:hypothetical protein
MAALGQMNHRKAAKLAEVMKGPEPVSDKTTGNNQTQQITTDRNQTVDISLMSAKAK